jgi:hypothetical protein
MDDSAHVSPRSRFVEGSIVSEFGPRLQVLDLAHHLLACGFAIWRRGCSAVSQFLFSRTTSCRGQAEQGIENTRTTTPIGIATIVKY